MVMNLWQRYINLQTRMLMSKEKRRVPKLRFPGFTEDWEQRKLESILIEYTEKNPGNEDLPVLTSSRQGLTKQEDHFGSVQRHDISDYNVIPLGFCTYRNRSDDKTFTFNINRIVSRGLVSKFYPVFDINNGNVDFITAYLNNNIGIIKSLAVNAIGTSQVVLSLRTLRNIEVTLPSKMEQVAIGNYIRKLDIYITLHQRKLNNLKLKKKALLQKLFPKNGERYPELRFPGFTDAWEQRKLSDISTKVTTKNIDVHYTETLTNSAEQGIISQVDFFDKEISNKDNINGYYIVENNDFIYNPRISTLAPVGPINRNKLNRTGIMSPLYTVFRASNVDLDFLEWYFQSSHWHRYMKLNGDSGARADRIAIKDSTFFDMPIKTPVNIKEQVLIGETLEKFNQYITLHQRKLDHLQLQKKALLQQMFV